MTQLLAESELVTQRSSVTVWDPLVRMFHWSLVGMFVIAFATKDTYEIVHQSAGYTVLALVALRILWGFVGSKHARFRDFCFPHREVARFVFETARFRAKRYVGHNPAGGLMVIVLMLTLLAISATGVMLTMEAFWGQKWVEETHEASVTIMLALIGLHLLGVLVASIEHGENLVLSMFTGRKRAPGDE